MKNSKFKILIFLFCLSTALFSQTKVNSLQELLPYLKQDKVKVKLAPGTYTIRAKDIKNGDFPDTTVVKNYANVLFLFSGNDSSYDFTDVTIQVKTEVFTAFKKRILSYMKFRLLGIII